jgi:hypothetical protein
MRTPGAAHERPLHDVTGEYLAKELGWTMLSCVEQVHTNANPAFVRTDAEVVVPTPVAAHQEEPATVRRGLLQYEAQLAQDAPPFALILSCNAPAPSKRTLAVKDTVLEFQEEHPDLPLSFFETYYPHGEPIGGIKKHVTDVSAQVLLEHYGNMLPEHVAILSQDADLWGLSRWFMKRMVDPIRAGASLTQANMRYARSNGQFPNMDRVMFWYDLPISLMPDPLHDTGNVMRLRSYIEAEGYNPTADLIVGITLQRQAAQRSLPFTRVRQRGTFVVTDPRRAYASMQAGAPPTEMRRGAFSDDQTHRTRGAEEFEDISTEMADAMIRKLSDIALDLSGVDSQGGHTSSLFATLRQRLWQELRSALQAEKLYIQPEDDRRLWNEAHARVEQIQRFGRAVDHLSRAA